MTKMTAVYTYTERRPKQGILLELHLIYTCSHPDTHTQSRKKRAAGLQSVAKQTMYLLSFSVCVCRLPYFNRSWLTWQACTSVSFCWPLVLCLHYTYHFPNFLNSCWDVLYMHQCRQNSCYGILVFIVILAPT